MATQASEFVQYCCELLASAPDDAMESPAVMAHWARLALQAALEVNRAKPPRSR